MPVPLLVDAEWLAAHLDDPSVRIIDASFHLPSANRDADAEYEASHIPGAIRFDIDAIKDTGNDLPHMLPSEAEFGRMVGALGISNEHHVIAYDTGSVSSAPRAWWMFRVMGHEKVSVLDGGLVAWKAAGQPTESGAVSKPATSFNAKLNSALLKSQQEVEAAAAAGEQIVDARSSARFTGEAPEPRAGLRSGHIPGSSNLPSDVLLDPETRRFHDETKIRALFQQIGIDLERPIITTCGSGVTAAVLSFGMALTGKPETGLYDGSWSEWGMPDGPPVATGAKLDKS